MTQPASHSDGWIDRVELYVALVLQFDIAAVTTSALLRADAGVW